MWRQSWGWQKTLLRKENSNLALTCHWKKCKFIGWRMIIFLIVFLFCYRRQKQAVFAIERDWKKYHSPRNVLLALVGEIGELSEIL